MNHEPTQSKTQSKIKLQDSLENYSLAELREFLEAIDRELEARSFADSIEAQMRLFLRRRNQ